MEYRWNVEMSNIPSNEFENKCESILATHALLNVQMNLTVGGKAPCSNVINSASLQEQEVTSPQKHGEDDTRMLQLYKGVIVLSLSVISDT